MGGRVWLRYLALQAVLWWSLGRSQEGFLSLDCGSKDIRSYQDNNTLEWVSDADYISEGTATPISPEGFDVPPVLTTMRVFDGSHSKSCYHLPDSFIEKGSFYLVRASFWGGISPPYTPQSSDAKFRFKLIVDAYIWEDVVVTHGSIDYNISEIYVRAQRDSIDVCFARSKPGGDAPFVSALEVRKLPSTLTSTKKMAQDGIFLVKKKRCDTGVALRYDGNIMRYPVDQLDRMWLLIGAEVADSLSTTSTNILPNEDVLPTSILQDFYFNPSITLSFPGLDPNVQYFAEFYFAEIGSLVDRSGLRVFNIYLNGSFQTTIDVFAQEGAYAAYSYPIAGRPDANGFMTFDFIAVSTSIYDPFLSAYELFSTGNLTGPTDAITVKAVEDLKASLSLTSYTGDPCLPIGYGYEWLNCSQSPDVTSIYLSNYSTGGKVPEALNSLTSLSEIHLDGNGLQGGIPDLSALTSLQVLVLSNNELTGSIPEYLAKLTQLKVLDLRNNKLSGEVPATLLEHKKAATLTFDFSGNTLCDTSNGTTCETSPEKRNNSVSIIIGVAVASILLVGFGIAVAVYCMCKKRPSSTLEQPPVVDPVRNPVLVIPKVIPKLSVQEFSFQEIQIATDNFSTLLGVGGFGPVYKGRLQDGHFVAMKVASDFSRQGPREFLNEVDLLSRVHHKNLVGLLGYCNEEKLVLVYDFMSNGSLFSRLHGPHAKDSPLSWSMRLQILVDAAQGLDYLHDGCNPRIIHRDVKSSNILLNDQLEAKISDFGISRNNFVDASGAPPTALMGSLGYMDPEYASSMNLTEKVDVYSFGVVLFEVVCGKTAVFTNVSRQQIHIVNWARSLIDCGVIGDLADPSLHQQYNISSIWKVLEIALACVSSSRPKMSAVFHELKVAKQMELECDSFDMPSAGICEGSEFNSLLVTHVNAR